MVREEGGCLLGLGLLMVGFGWGYWRAGKILSYFSFFFVIIVFMAWLKSHETLML